MRRITFLGLLIAFAASGCATPALQIRQESSRGYVARAASDRLEAIANDAENGPSSAAKKKERREEKKGDEPATSEETIWGPFMVKLLLAPFTVPQYLLGDDLDNCTFIPDYPYVEDLPGSMVINTDYVGKRQWWLGTIQAFGVDGTDHVQRAGGRLLLDSESRFGIDTETNYWTESISNAQTDQLWTGDANLTFRFAEGNQMQWRAGLGMNWLSDKSRTETGFNFTYGFEWFPMKPWTIASVIDVGKIGDGVLFHNRTTAGVMVGPVEAFAGYDYFQLDSICIHGPVAGLGYRF